MGLHGGRGAGRAREQVAEPLGLAAEAAAAGVFDVLLARTVGAVRQITVERGHDPRGFSLLAFGGAGPLLAPLLAREMGIREVIVPFAPSGFSAWGMLVGRHRGRLLPHCDDHTGRRGPGRAGGALQGSWRRTPWLADRPRGRPRRQRCWSAQLELRYLGQEHSLIVTVGRELRPGRDPGRVRGATPRAVRPHDGQPAADPEPAGARHRPHPAPGAGAAAGRRRRPGRGRCAGAGTAYDFGRPRDGDRSPCTTETCSHRATASPARRWSTRAPPPPSCSSGQRVAGRPVRVPARDAGGGGQ